MFSAKILHEVSDRRQQIFRMEGGEKMNVTKYYAIAIVMAFLVGVVASSLLPQPIRAEGGSDPDKCICYTMAYCMDPALPKCGCPDGWAILTYDMTMKYSPNTPCTGDYCDWAVCQGGGVGCIEDCLPMLP